MQTKQRVRLERQLVQKFFFPPSPPSFTQSEKILSRNPNRTNPHWKPTPRVFYTGHTNKLKDKKKKKKQCLSFTTKHFFVSNNKTLCLKLLKRKCARKRIQILSAVPCYTSSATSDSSPPLSSMLLWFWQQFSLLTHQTVTAYKGSSLVLLSYFTFWSIQFHGSKHSKFDNAKLG